MDQKSHQAATASDCAPHESHGMHTHGEDCGHAALQHGDHKDYVHDTHRHARHEGHWDEHAPTATLEGSTVGRPGGVG